MALLSKREFAEEKCGMQTKALSVYIGRGQVVVGQDGLVDTDNAINILFMQERQAKRQNGHQDPPVTADTVVAAVAEAKPKIKEKVARTGRAAQDREINEGVKEKMGLDKRMKEIEIEKKQRESQLLKNKQDRAAGKLIPTAIVKGLFQNHFKAVVISFKQGIDQMIVEIAKKKSMNINERAELKREMIKILNGCIDDTIKISKRDVANLVTEYSQTSEE